MIPSAVLLTKPSIDFGTFLGLSQQALGYSLNQAVDASPIKRSEVEQYVSCLAAMKNAEAVPGFTPNLLAQVSFSLMAAAETQGMLDILQVVSGMAFVVSATQVHGIQLAVIAGTLAQWRSAVLAGSTRGTDRDVRSFFNRVMGVFQEAGADVWKDCDQRLMPDKTLLLEDKRPR